MVGLPGQPGEQGNPGQQTETGDDAADGCDAYLSDGESDRRLSIELHR